jgi:hypothetical protein
MRVPKPGTGVLKLGMSLSKLGMSLSKLEMGLSMLQNRPTDWAVSGFERANSRLIEAAP